MMKKKQARLFANSESRGSTSSCSDDERMKSVTRSSARKKKVSAHGNRSSTTTSSLVDSAYEADDSARSDTSPPKQHQPMNEYHIEAIDDVPIVAKTRKRKNVPQNTKTKKTKKPKTNLNMSTSTPVFEGAKSRDDTNCSLVTPEVTPILAEDHATKHKVNIHRQTLSTPTLRRSLRKRSFSFQDPDLSAISTELSFDSQADSGIMVSPPLKKVKPTRTAVISSNSPKCPGKLSKEDLSTVSVKKSSSSASTQKYDKSKNLLVSHKHESYSIKGKSVLRESPLNSSCFGFDSIQTPSPVSRPKKSRKNPVKKIVPPSKKAYRSPVKNSSDSMFGDSPGCDSNSSNSNTDSQENIFISHQSPSLFSEEMFSDDTDQPAVNKSSTKSYKGFKASIKKSSKPKVSKLDAWANSFNTELESIEKFDLNIE